MSNKKSISYCNSLLLIHHFEVLLWGVWKLKYSFKIWSQLILLWMPYSRNHIHISFSSWGIKLSRIMQSDWLVILWSITQEKFFFSRNEICEGRPRTTIILIWHYFQSNQIKTSFCKHFFAQIFFLFHLSKILFSLNIERR